MRYIFRSFRSKRQEIPIKIASCGDSSFAIWRGAIALSTALLGFAFYLALRAAATARYMKGVSRAAMRSFMAYWPTIIWTRTEFGRMP